MRTRELSTSRGLLGRLASRFWHFAEAQYPSTWAGDFSEEHPQSDYEHASRCVVEPRLSIRSAREIRSFLLYIVQESEHQSDVVYPLLMEIQDRIKSKKDPIWLKINLAIKFLLDRTFSGSQPLEQTILAMLNYHPRSYLGNDRKLAEDLLRRWDFKLRVLQRSKAVKSSLKRPKEKSSPTHVWLPGWQKQYQADKVESFEETPDEIWDLLSPVEVLGHLRRQRN